MKIGMYGPVADEIARLQLRSQGHEVSEQHVITGMWSSVEILDDVALEEALEGCDDGFGLEATKVVDAANDTAIKVELPRNLWLFTLTRDGKEPVTGFVQFTDEQSEQVSQTLHQREAP